jgi:TolA-binding protein
MTYGAMLWEHHMPLYALKEMLKVSHNVYTKPGKRLPEARYRAGICCLALNRPDAAALQFRMCTAYWPDSPWATKATQALAKLAAQPEPTRGLVEAAMQKPVPELLGPAKGPPQQRFFMAEEFFRMGIFSDDQCVLEYLKALTVTDPSGKRNAKLKPPGELKCGIVLRKLGREGAAREHWHRVIELAPDSQHADNARELLGQEAS